MACRSDHARQEQARLLTLAEHIDRLRRANNADKRALLAQLTLLECQDAEACGLKDLCVRAYELHQRVLDSIETMQRAAARDASPPEPALRARFGQTERDLAAARGLTESCAEEQVRVVRKALL